MIKHITLIYFIFLSAFISCNKLDVYTDDLSKAPGTLAKIGGANQIVAIDTLVPANAVNAKTFGIIGDGVHDDTDDLQKLINNQTTILLPAGTYIINKTLSLRSNVKLYGATGAIISAGTNMAGTLLTNGRYLFLNNADNCLIYNIILKPSTQSFALSNWSNACIYAANSKGTNVVSNTFNFNFNYSKTGLEAVWFTGSGTTNTIIKGNKLYTVGIEFAEAGASSSLVENNYIKNAHSVAIDGHGNSNTFCTDNIISNNIVEYPGYIGIEDWGNTSGTVIKNNKVLHTGQDPTQGKDAMGISSVGLNPRILQNQITDAFLYYIEIAGGSDHLVDGNIINDTNQATGIIVNYTAVKTDNTVALSDKVIISNNQINNCDIGVSYYGKNNINTELRSNIIKNAKTIGVNIDSDAALITANIIDNSLVFEQPTTQPRYGFQAYTRLAPGTAKHNITYTNNDINYAGITTDSPGIDYSFFITTNNTNLTSNTIKALGANVYAVSNTSAYVVSLYLIKNTFTGVKNDLSRFNLLANTGNHISSK